MVKNEEEELLNQIILLSLFETICTYSVFFLGKIVILTLQLFLATLAVRGEHRLYFFR